MDKPIVGITTGLNPEYPGTRSELYVPYAEAVERAGADFVFLHPRVADEEQIDEILKGIDGLLLSGGKDVHPKFYDPATESWGAEQLQEYHMNYDPERDEFEISLARAAHEAGVPIFGICRGFQLLNVALGGSLIKDMRTGRKHWAYRREESEEGTPGESRKHLVTVLSGSRLSELIGDCPRLVNSRHHQGIMETEKSAGLKATAFAPDGIIEGVEGVEHPWAIAVQWHPERSADSYIFEPCRALFDGLVHACLELGKATGAGHSPGNSA